MLARILAGAGALALALGLSWMHGNARYEAGRLAERSAWQKVAATKEAEITDLRISGERDRAAATKGFADALAAQEPIIIRSTDTVTRYELTPAGAALCLAADRVLGIDADAAALGLEAGPTAGNGNGAVSPNADQTQP